MAVERPVLDVRVVEHPEARHWSFEDPSSGQWIVVAAILVVAGVVFFLLPQYRIAPLVLALFATWQLAAATAIDRLVLDLDSRRWTRQQGMALRRHVREGNFDDLGAIVLARAELQPGLAESALRSHRLFLEMGAADEASAAVRRSRFPIGFPMGAKAAEHLAGLAAERLGLEVSTEEPGPPAEEAVAREGEGTTRDDVEIGA